jgi:cell division protein FtsI (penicillin-binding protein 3)
LVVLVLVDEPEVNVYGGVVAAPVFRNIARGALRHLVVAPQQPNAALSQVGQAELPAPRLPKKENNEAFNGGAGAVPDFVGLSLREAVEKARSLNVKVQMHGNGYVIKQAPSAGGHWNEAGVLVLNLQG